MSRAPAILPTHPDRPQLQTASHEAAAVTVIHENCCKPCARLLAAPWQSVPGCQRSAGCMLWLRKFLSMPARPFTGWTRSRRTRPPRVPSVGSARPAPARRCCPSSAARRTCRRPSRQPQRRKRSASVSGRSTGNAEPVCHCIPCHLEQTAGLSYLSRGVQRLRTLLVWCSTRLSAGGTKADTRRCTDHHLLGWPGRTGTAAALTTTRSTGSARRRAGSSVTRRRSTR